MNVQYFWFTCKKNGNARRKKVLSTCERSGETSRKPDRPDKRHGHAGQRAPELKGSEGLVYQETLETLALFPFFTSKRGLFIFLIGATHSKGARGMCSAPDRRKFARSFTGFVRVKKKKKRTEMTRTKRVTERYLRNSPDVAAVEAEDKQEIIKTVKNQI